MKKFFLGIISVLSLLSYALPLQAQQAFYIYRNDGAINTFITTEIDSMTYSRLDIDSIAHDEYVVHEVYTPDSIYRIPIEVIDSVGFVTPETVYQPGVKVLEGDMRSYIISRDELTLMFQSNTPNSLLPHVGDKLVTTEVDDVITNAFVGQVSEVNSKSDCIEVVCEPVDLTDVFECYYGIIRKTDESVSVRRRNLSDGFFGTNGTRTLKPGKLTCDLFNTHEISFQYKVDDEDDNLSYSLDNAKASISLTPTIDYNAYLIINKAYGTNISVTAVGNYTMEEVLALSGSVHVSDDAPLFEKAIPIPEALIDVFFEFGIFVDAKGTLSIDQVWTQNYKHVFHWEWSSKGHESLQKVNDFRPVSSSHQGKVALSGDLNVGAYGKVGIAFIATSSLDIAQIDLRVEGGLNLTGTYVPYKRDEEYAKKSTDLYNQIKDREVGVYWYYGLSGEATLFRWSVSKQVPNFMNLPLNKKGKILGFRLVPLFEDTKLSKDEGGAYYASTKVFEDVFTTDVGFALINKNNEDDGTYSYCIYDYKGPKAEAYASFYDIPNSNSYTVYPLVKYMDMELIAEPSAEIDMCPDENHPHMIDLGLPSGTKWACCNIGASAPYELGGRYAWGETEEKSSYSASNYKFAQASTDGWMEIDGILYNFINIGENICGTNYDVANVKWGNSWRMPSVSDIEELVSQCTWQLESEDWTYYYKVTGPNGASIVLPGYWLNYWTGNLNHEASYWWNHFDPIPYVLWSDPTPHVHSPTGSSSELGYFTAAYQGCSVRAVYDSNINATRKKAINENSSIKSVREDSLEKIVVIANEETEMTEDGKRTYTKVIRK